MKPLAWACIFAGMLIPNAAAQRLPDIAVPDHYELSFAPDFANDQFSGTEKIQVRVLKTSPEIVLNAAELSLQEASITAAGKTQSAKITLDKAREIATLSVAQPLPPGPATIEIRFTGILNSELRGFYLGKDDHGRKYAATQFESTDSRRAFPSFDEPAYKATFDVTVTAPKEMVVISNTMPVSDVPGPAANSHTVRFATTPKMSSYLVAMIVGQFDYVEGSAEGIPIRVFSTAGKKQLGMYALQSAGEILRFYNQYFAIKYPYGKLDLIALPDFSAGAMENTACITFRENALLLDDQRASVNQHRGVAGVIAHEMAHQWFGDLVTMKWWDDIWLNEGFATWMSSKPLEKMKPDWNIHMDEVLGTVEALNVDSLSNTRPIQQAAETPVEIEGLFDGIAYGKAAAVLRMVEAYLGAEVFRSGVNEYLKEHAYGNATAEDFWNTLTRVSQKPADAIMSTFVKQAGAPILNLKARCTNNATIVDLSQERYYYDRSKFYEGNDQLWNVPVCLRQGGEDKGETHCELLTKRQQNFSIPGCGSWVLDNAHADGDYRSSYPPQMVQALSRDAETELSPGERIMLLADLWASMRAGRSDIGDYLTLAAGLQADRNGAVVRYLLAQIDYIGVYLVGDSDRPAYQAWVRNLLTPLAHDLGLAPKPGETDDQKNLRAAVLHSLGLTAADSEVLAEANKQARMALRDPLSVSPELMPVFLGLAAHNGDAQFYDGVLAKTKNAEIPENYYSYLATLSSFGDPQLLKRTLEFAISGQVRSQDAKGVIGRVMQNPQGRAVAWEFVRSHWSDISRVGGPFRSGDIIGSAGSFCDAEQEDQVREFFSTHPTQTSERLLKQTLERIDYCVDLKSREQDPLSAWLGEHGDKGN
jgi:aminopeptidase N/puromycin-sensitive aminopeptidase